MINLCKIKVIREIKYQKSSTWQYHQHAVDFWIRNSLNKSMWNSFFKDPDIVYFDTDINYLCANQKQGKAKFMFHRKWEMILNISVPKFIPALVSCHGSLSIIARKLHLTLLSEISNEHSLTIPYVVNRINMNIIHFKKNKQYIFMAGHMPKAYISNVRFNIWKQLIHRKDSTILSSDIACTYGSFIQCRTGNVYNSTNCYGNKFDKQCKYYSHVQYDQIPQIFNSSKLTQSQYLNHAFNHEFCIVAPGDTLSTHKLAESIVVGGMGGCIPIIVVPSNPYMMLPFIRWFDYCKGTVLVSIETATHNMSLFAKKVLPNINVREKKNYLKQNYHAFLSENVGDYILSEMCASAKKYKIPKLQCDLF